MEKIPKPILSDILSQVGLIDQVFTLSTVCKRWNDIISNWNHEISFQDIASDNPNHRSYIKKVLWNNFVKLKWKLISLDLKSVDVDETVLANLLMVQPNLKKLVLSNSKINLRKLWNLINIKTSEYFAENKIEILFPLEELHFSNFNDSFWNHINLLSFFPKLQKLNIGNCNLTVGVFNSILDNFRNIKFLEASPRFAVWSAYDLEQTKIKLESGNLKFWLTSSSYLFKVNKIYIYNYDALSFKNFDLEEMQKWLKLGGDINTCYKLIYKLIEVYDDDFLIQIFQIFVKNGLDKWYHKCSHHFNYFYYAATNKKWKLLWYLIDNNFYIFHCNKCNIFTWCPEIIEMLLIYPTKSIPGLSDKKLYEAAQYFILYNKEEYLLPIIELIGYTSAGINEEDIIHKVKQHSIRDKIFWVQKYLTRIFRLFKVSEIQPLISIAAMYENKKIIKKLLLSGFKINAKDTAGNTAFYYVAKYGKTDILQYLLKNLGDADIAANDITNSEIYNSLSNLTTNEEIEEPGNLIYEL